MMVKLDYEDTHQRKEIESFFNTMNILSPLLIFCSLASPARIISSMRRSKNQVLSRIYLEKSNGLSSPQKLARIVRLVFSRKLKESEKP